MRRLPLCLLALAGILPLCAAHFDTARWTHVASIAVTRNPQRGVIVCSLSPEVFDLARPDLADLRVTDARGDELGYLVKPSGRTYSGMSRVTTLYNRAFRPGKSSTITADVGSGPPIDRLVIVTSGSNFHRRVRIEGSDAGRDWQTIRDDGVLTRVTDSNRVAYDQDTVNIPDNAQRYLRITVFNAPDDPSRIGIRSVATVHSVQNTATAVPVSVRSVTRSEEPTRTHLTLDLGHKNLPLWELELSAGDANFYRIAYVYGRNAWVRKVQVPVEDAPARETHVEEPWQEIASGTLYRDRKRGSALTLKLGGVRCRFLRVVIENGDNDPLQLGTPGVKRLDYQLYFQPAPGAGYRLYLGNTSVSSPVYDLPKYFDAVSADGITAAKLEAVTPNPAQASGRVPTRWYFESRVLIWLALLAVFAVLLLLIVRQVRSVRSAGSPGGES